MKVKGKVKTGIMQKPSGNCYPILSQVRIMKGFVMIHGELIDGILCFAEVLKRKIRYPWQMSTMNIST